MTTITNQRNAIYMNQSGTLIDLEIETDEFGWIPTSINMDDADPAAHIIAVKSWLTDNVNLIAAYTQPPPEPIVIPYVVTMRQARLALLQNGQLATVQSALDSLPEPQKSAALIEWEYAQTVDRNGTLTASMIVVLGLTEQATDDLFVLAAGL